MTRLYLITGFLGAGKTTFLKNLIALLAPRRLHLIINEFGREGVDGALLAALAPALSEINNGSIFCSCRLDLFESALEQALAASPEVILVEASGLADPTALGGILAQKERFAALDYRGSICLVDAARFQKLFTAVPVCQKQLSVADLVLLNQCDLVTPAKQEEIRAFLAERFPHAAVRETSFAALEPSWLEALGQRTLPPSPPPSAKDLTLQKASITIKAAMSRYSFEKFIRMILPETHRVKGFVALEGALCLVDCVGERFSMVPWEGPVPQVNTVVALAGAGMALRKSIAHAASWYPNDIEKVDY